jgi:hypothetical protein
METWQVEMARLWDDGTWDTDTIEVEVAEGTAEKTVEELAISRYYNEMLADNLSLVAVYNLRPAKEDHHGEGS